jgi:hypothetical protein
VPAEDSDLRHLDDAALCNVVDITGAVAPLKGEGPTPALVFRFTHIDGTELPPAVLVLNEPCVAELIRVLTAEAHLAVIKTRAMRRLS